MNYFEVWMGDYLRKTLDFDATEHGVYFMLMFAYYSDEKPLSSDMKKLYRICKAHTKHQRDSVEKVVGEFFTLEGDGCYHNAKCDEMIERFRLRSASASEAGKISAEVRKSNKKAETANDRSESVPTERQRNSNSLNPKPQTLNPNEEYNINTPEVSVAVIKEELIDFELSELLFTRIRGYDPKAREPNYSSWAKHIRLLRVKDEREPEEIRSVIEWCQKAGNFWQPNIQSTATLREKYSRLLQQMQREFLTASQIKNGNPNSVNRRLAYDPEETERGLVELGKKIMSQSQSIGNSG